MKPLRWVCQNGGMTHTRKRETPYNARRRVAAEAQRKVNFRQFIEEEGGLQGQSSFFFTASKTHSSPWVLYMVKSDRDVPYPNFKSYVREGWIKSVRRWKTPNGALMDTYEVTDAGWAVIESVEA